MVAGSNGRQGGSSSKSAPKRTSSRVHVVSKAMRVVDVETRREVRDKRLAALEADNYNEVQNEVQDDDAYDDEGEDGPVSKKARGGGGKKGTKVGKFLPRKIRSLDRIIDSQRYDLAKQAKEDDKDSNGDVGTSEPPSRTRACYLSAAAGPATRPGRNFCSVCGYCGSYTCTRCGMRFCSIRCNKHHKETRCLKFAAF